MAALVGGRGRSANAPCGTGWFVRCVAIRCNNLYLLLNNKDYGMSHSLPSDYLIHVVSGCLACTTVVQAGQPQQTCTSSVSGMLNWPVQNVLQIISTHSFDSSPHPIPLFLHLYCSWARRTSPGELLELLLFILGATMVAGALLNMCVLPL